MSPTRYAPLALWLLATPVARAAAPTTEACCSAPLREAPAPGATTPALSDADLDRHEAALRSPDPAVRLAAARAIAAAGPEGYERYAARLRRPLLGSDAALRALVHAIWAQYPNPEYPRGPGKDPQMWFVRPEPRWTPPPREPGKPRARRPPPHDPETVDWLTALAEVNLEREPLLNEPAPIPTTPAPTPRRGAKAPAPLPPPPPAPIPAAEREQARFELLSRVALMRAVANAGRSGRREAVVPLFEQAFTREGILRDECGRAIRSIGSYGVPALIRIYNDRTRANAKMRRYASYQLDRMDRLRPSKAISTAPDDHTRADIIHAYGEPRALDAVEAILGQVDAGSQRVRREARWAWLRYVDGSPPPAAPKRKRKLPGGKEESEEKEDYLNYREMATLAIQKKAQEELSLTPAVTATLSAKQLTDRLFALYDQRREAEFAQLFQRAKEREAQGDPAGAVDLFGWILAHQPDHPRRADMAGAYRALGERLSGPDPARTLSQGPAGQAAISRALGALRQALALSGAAADSREERQQRARIHYLDGLQAEALGGSGQRDFALAAAADPDFAPARRRVVAVQIKAAPATRLLPLLLLLLLPLCYLLARRLGWLGGKPHPAAG